MLIDAVPFITEADISLRKGEKEIKSSFIDHALFNTKIGVWLHQSCQAEGDLKLVHSSNIYRLQGTDALWLHPKRHKNNHWGWPVQYIYKSRAEIKPVVPDNMVAIEHKPSGKRIYLTIEADCETEPQKRNRQNRTEMSNRSGPQ